MSVGRELQTARVRAGLSLEDLSHSTKLRLGVLHALERGDVTALPPLVFVRGYLAAYAREVGLDAKDIAERGLAELLALSAPVASRTAFASRQSAGSVHTSPVQGTTGRRWTAAAWIAIAAVGVVGTMIYVTNAPAPDRSSVLVASARVLPPDEPTAIPDDPAVKTFRVELTTSRPVFISATSDGASVVARQLDAGERQIIESAGRMVLRISDPRPIAWLVDGRPGIPLGSSDEPVTIQLSADTLDEYVVR